MPEYPAIGSVASNPFGWGVRPFTFLPSQSATAVTLNAVFCLWHRVIGGGPISKLGFQVGTQGGNIAVAVGRGVRGGAGPTSLLATSGSVACPAPGYAEVALGASVNVNPETDWFCIAGDTGTATVLAASAMTLGSTGLCTGFAAFENVFPVPATPNTTPGWARGVCLVGVA